MKVAARAKMAQVQTLWCDRPAHMRLLFVVRESVVIPEKSGARMGSA